MTPAWLQCACATLLLATLCTAATPLTTLYEWRQMEFAFPSPAHKQALIQQGIYLPNASVPLDVDYHKGRVFITTPRFRTGVPATLATVARGSGNNLSPLLEPYPDWSWHKPGYCDGMTSVFRITIDECGRLWAIDTGSVDIFVSIRHVCPKQLLVFDLSNDKLITRHRFPATVVKADTIFTSIQVEVVNARDRKCRGSYAYITDTTTYGLVVYDMKNDRSWRVTDNTFWPIPRFGFYQLQGSEFNLMDGVLGVALSPPDNNQPRQLYYHSLASNTENHVPTSVLQKEANFANNGNTARQNFRTFRKTRLGQSAAQDMSSTGVLFYSELVEPSLKCYSTRTRYQGAHNPTVARDPQRLQFAAGMKVRRNEQGLEEVWILTDRLQKLMVGTLTPTEVNFRVLKGNVNQLVANTECATTRNPINFGTRMGESGEEGAEPGEQPAALVDTSQIVFKEN